ncbi:MULTISPECIES: pyridoxamine 5'-phosphate oxidase family protein [Salinibaculum]|uniref:pyridoxamine 5'-phosphate oxidase family protein n=1 Tax=Salinibaculum TaxID=2732368 RepID=UPI0030D34A14
MLEDIIEESNTARMSDAQIREYLLAQGVGVLGLPDAEFPYLIPMSFGYDGESTLYFLFLLFGGDTQKESLSDRSARATFVVYSAESKFEWRSVILKGTIAPVPNEEFGELQEAMENAWHPDLFSSASPQRGVQGYKLEIEESNGIWNRSSPRSSDVSHTF